MTDAPTDPFADSRLAEETFLLEPAPNWVEQADIPWETRPAPDDHVVTLLAHTQWSPERFLRHERNVRLLVSREAVQKLSQIELEWDPAVERLIVHEVAIWRQGAKRSFMERSRFLLRQREGGFEQQLVHGRMSALVLLDDVRMGDVVELEFSILSQARLPGEKFDAIYAAERTVTTGKWIVSVLLPEGSPFRWCGSSPDIEWSETRLQDRNEIVRTFAGTQETPVLIEAGIPPWVIPYQHFQISGYDSWSEVAQCIAHAWESVPLDPDALRRFAEEIAGEAATAEDKAYAIIDWVQEHVRYLGMVGGTGGLRPQSPNLVFERRYGDCKDKTLLLCSLLQQIGIDAEPVLVNTMRLHGVGTALPGLGAFDHVIASFEIGGRRGFVDATTSGDGGGIFDRCLPPYGLGLPVRADADHLVEVPHRGIERSSLLVSEDLHLHPKEPQSYIDWRIEAVGNDANQLRARLRAVGADTFGKVEAEDLRSYFPTARSVGTTKWVDDKAVNRVIVRGRAAFADWGANPKGGRKTLQYKPRWLYHALSAPSLAEKRTHPFQLVFPATVRHEIWVHQKRHGFSQTFRLKSDSPYFQTSTAIRRLSDKSIEATYTYRTSVGIITPEQVDDYWRHLDNAVANQLGLTLVLRGKDKGKRSLPDDIETVLPAQDETSPWEARLDPSAEINTENWLKKDQPGKFAFLKGVSPWSIAVIVLFGLGTLGSLVEKCQKAPSNRQTGQPQSSVAQFSEANLAYATWEKAFFDERRQDALAHLQAFDRSSRGDTRVLYAAARMAVRTGSLDEAERYLNEIPSGVHFLTDVTVLRGEIALARRDLAKAREIAIDVIVGFPTHALGWQLSALVQEAEGQPSLAVEQIGKASRLAPGNFSVRSTELRMLTELAGLDAAYSAAMEGERDFPRHSFFTEWIADYHAREGRFKEAVSKAREALGRSEDKPRCRIVLARILALSPRAGDREEAEGLYREMASLAGDDVDALLRLAHAANVADDPRWALDLLTRATGLSPRADILADLAAVLIALGRTEEARGHLEKALASDPASKEARTVFLILADATKDEALKTRLLEGSGR